MTIAVFLPAPSPITIQAGPPPPHPIPQPPPTYEKAMLGTVVPHPKNPALKAVELSDGLYLCVATDGTLRHDPVADKITPDHANAGPWQAFQLCTNTSHLIAGRDGGNVWMIPYGAYDGPATP